MGPTCHPGDGLIDALVGGEPALAIDRTLIARKDAAAGNQSFDGGTLFLDYTNNFVGVRTTIPTAALDVGGDAAISGDVFGEVYRWNTPKTLEYAVGAADFRSTQPELFSNNGFTINAGLQPANVQHNVYAPVRLPANAVILALRCYFQDDATTGGFIDTGAVLMSSEPTDTLGFNHVSFDGFATSGATFLMQTATAVNPSPTSVPQGARAWVFVSLKTSVQTSSLQFYGCGIEYRLDGPG